MRKDNNNEKIFKECANHRYNGMWLVLKIFLSCTKLLLNIIKKLYLILNEKSYNFKSGLIPSCKIWLIILTY